MKNNLNKGVLFVAVVAVAIWMVMKYMEGRKSRENYEMNKDGLLDYIENSDQLNATYVMTNVAKLTKDDDFIMSAYDLANVDDRKNLYEFVKTL
jgi:hypothetical protein